MTSPVSAVEAIEMVARSLALEIYENAVDSDDGSHSMDMPVAVALITDAMTSLARKAEALQREKAELREALQNLMGCYDTPLSRRRFPPDDFMSEALSGARALLGGENAE